MPRVGEPDQPHRRRFGAALTRAVSALGGDRAAEVASGVNKSIWYDAKTGRAVPNSRTTWPAMRALLSTLPVARTSVPDWDVLYEAVCLEAGRRHRRPAAPSVRAAHDVRQPVPRQLPPSSATFTARDAELAVLDRVLLHDDRPAVPIAVVVGSPGVGKTALALHWAHRNGARFSDGVLYVDLRGWDAERPLSADAVLPGWLRAFGMELAEGATGLEDQVSMLRSALDRRQVLMVLDNAYSEEQIRPLLPGSPSCAVLATSRRAMPGLAVHHGATVVQLDPLSHDESIELLHAIVGVRADREPHAAAALVEWCGRLPLPLRIVAEYARQRPDVTLRDVVDTFTDGGSRLDTLDGDDPRSDPRTVFSWSVRRLDDDVAGVFRLLGLHPGGTFDAGAAAALTGTPTRAAGAHLRALRRAHLLMEAGGGRYRMHDLLRVYAAELVHATEPASTAAAARTRLTQYYLATARRAEAMIEPYRYRPPLPGAGPAGPSFADKDRALAWLDDECDTIVNLCCLDEPALDDLRWRLAYEVKGYFFLTKRLSAWVASHEAAAAAAVRAGDRLGEAMTRSNLGLALHERGDEVAALAQYERAHECFDEVGDRHGVSNTLAHRAAVHRRLGELDRSLGLGRQALAFYREAGADRNVAITLRGVAAAELGLGELTDAERHLTESLAICGRLGMDLDAARAQRALGQALLRAGRPEDSAAAFRAGLAASELCGSRFERALALHGLGAVAVATGEVGQARVYWQDALSELRALGSPRARQVVADLAALPEA